MAPAKITRPATTFTTTTRSLAARAKAKTSVAIDIDARLPRVKRKASPLKETGVKRSALGEININVTSQNKVANDKLRPVRKVVVQTKQLPTVKTVVKPKQNENAAPPCAPVQKIQTRASVRNSGVNHTAFKPKESNSQVAKDKIKTRLSNEFDKTGDSLYASALEDVDVSTGNSIEPPRTRSRTLSAERAASSVNLVAQQLAHRLSLGKHEVPEGVNNFDKENWDDVLQVSHYTMDIFNYMKNREPLCVIQDYMDKQICLSTWMRSILVDWMVEVQETFELNHETLYLGVKLVDFYLSKVTVSKDALQLVGAACMLIASKYDERIPPSVDNFLYICDGAYKRRELLRMEINVLKVCDFNLGLPLSYRFLRRYARCAKVTMPVLTLARYILEYSLMDYTTTVLIVDSKLAAASLYLALQMKKIGGWNETLQFYSGYKLDQIMSTVHLLNNGLHRKHSAQLTTIRNKYSHKIFFEVAKTPLLTNDRLES